jgi:predicted RNA-binding Zn-ribbon protein involved in translation (DUF1610 family)
MNDSSVNDLFPNPRAHELIVCVHCEHPLEVDHVIREGETLYKPCPNCGRVGLKRQGDLYTPGQHKKAYRLCYWERGA